MSALVLALLLGNDPPEAVKKAIADIQGANFQVSTSAPKRDTVPAVAWNSVDNEWVVVWEHWFDNQPLDRDIRARRISSTGALLGSETVIVQLTTDETMPRIAYSPTTQRFMVVWVHDAKDVKAKIVNNLLAQVVAPFYIDLFTQGTSKEPDVVWRQNEDDFFIAWSETGGPGNQQDLYGSLWNTDGTVKRDNIILRDVGNGVDLRRPTLAYNAADDEYFMAYDNQNDSDTGAADIFGFRIDGTVTYQLSDIALISNSSGIQVDATIVFNGSSEYLVAWEDDSNGDWDVFGRKLTKAGVVSGSSVALRFSADVETDPVLAWRTAASVYVLAWEEQTANGDWDIYARAVSTSLAIGTPERISRPTSDPATETSNEYNPALMLNATTGEYLFVWQDGRSGVFDIWAQRATYASPGVPATPTNLGHSANTTTSITWTWTDNSTDETGFKLETDTHLVKASPAANAVTETEESLTENAKTSRHIHSTNANGDSPPSNTATAYTSVHEPVLADFSLTVVSATRIDVTVTAPPNSLADFTGVEISRSTDDATYAVVRVFGNTYTFSDTTVLPNKTYYYKVRFRNGDADQSALSPQRNATTPADATVPAAPTGLTAAGGTTSIALNWTANTESDLAGYKVLRSDTAGGPYSEIAGNVGTNSYTDTGLPQGVTRYYVVRAFDTSNNVSGNSNEASASTGGLPPPPIITTPNKKTNDTTPIVQGTAEANSTVTVKFGSITYGTTTAAADGSWTVHAISNPFADGTYSVTATATNGNGTSQPSAAKSIEIDTTAPSAPTNLTITVRDGALELAWTASSSSDTLGYNIWRKAPGEQNFTKINPQVVVGTQYRDAGLQNGQTYFYKVTAVDNALNEAH